MNDMTEYEGEHLSVEDSGPGRKMAVRMAGVDALTVAPHQEHLYVQLLRTPSQRQSRRCVEPSKIFVSCLLSHFMLILSRLGGNTHLVACK